jgi:hypothetical protein
MNRYIAQQAHCDAQLRAPFSITAKTVEMLLILIDASRCSKSSAARRGFGAIGRPHRGGNPYEAGVARWEGFFGNAVEAKEGLSGSVLAFQGPGRA